MALRLAAAGLAGTAALLLAAPTAYAATGSPPVTNPDHVTLRAGEGVAVDVTANDTDPDGAQLEVCRLGPLPRALRQSFAESGDLVVVSDRGARGTYALTYYACDESYLTAGTLTVTVRPPAPTFDIIPVGAAPPGRIRLVNTYKFQTFHCEWRAQGSDKIEGRAVVRPRRTVVIQVHEAELEITCTSPRASVGASFNEFRRTRLG
jgi:Bacterial Ig domain